VLQVDQIAAVGTEETAAGEAFLQFH
jgi:hypothetical protein